MISDAADTRLYVYRSPAEDDVNNEFELIGLNERKSCRTGSDWRRRLEAQEPSLDALSDSSLSTVEDLRNDRRKLEDDDDDEEEEDPLLIVTDVSEEEQPVLSGQRRFRLARFSQIRRRGAKSRGKEIDVEKYMAQREMTATQERWNAVTVLPNPIYCLYFLLAGCWIDDELVEQVRSEMETNLNWATTPPDPNHRYYGFAGFANDVAGDSRGCLSGASWWHGVMPALPPLPVVAAAVGICLHAPFSFLYHWRYAHALPPGAPRTTHWSRRWDQGMIHVISACMSYATSGSWDYFVANLLYNADCFYRQFQEKVRPRRNQTRIAISVVCYTLPILKRGELLLFGQLWTVFLTSSWLFAMYPIGGWSHSVFHLVIALVPPLLMVAAAELPASQEQLRVAAQCFVLREQQINALEDSSSL
jgi:hypothetical protein